MTIPSTRIAVFALLLIGIPKNVCLASNSITITSLSQFDLSSYEVLNKLLKLPLFPHARYDNGDDEANAKPVAMHEILTLKGTPIGHCKYGYYPGTSDGYIAYLGISAEHQSNGYGSLLLKNAISNLEQQGITRIGLRVFFHHKNQKAVKFYQNHEFIADTQEVDVMWRVCINPAHEPTSTAQRTFTRGSGYWTQESDEAKKDFFSKLTNPASQREDWYKISPYIAEFWCTLTNIGFLCVGLKHRSPELIFAGMASIASHSIPKQWLLYS